VAPALLSLAEMRRVTGPELLLGFEIEYRIDGAVSPGHYPKGWHITSTCGVFGSAAGAAKLPGLTARGPPCSRRRAQPGRQKIGSPHAGKPMEAGFCPCERAHLKRACVVP